jgi:hypothetical protein
VVQNASETIPVSIERPAADKLPYGLPIAASTGGGKSAVNVGYLVRSRPAGHVICFSSQVKFTPPFFCSGRPARSKNPLVEGSSHISPFSPSAYGAELDPSSKFFEIGSFARPPQFHEICRRSPPAKEPRGRTGTLGNAREIQEDDGRQIRPSPRDASGLYFLSYLLYPRARWDPRGSLVG